MIANRPLTRDDLPFPTDRPMTGDDLLQMFPVLFGPLWTKAAEAVCGTVAVVAAIGVAPANVTLTVEGQPLVCRYLAGYAPTVGDRVLVLRNAAQGIVLGVLA